MFHHVLLRIICIYSYLCYVELSRGTDLESLFYDGFTMFLRCFTTFYSALFVYSYLCYVELSRGTDLEALFYDVLKMFYHVLLRIICVLLPLLC